MRQSPHFTFPQSHSSVDLLLLPHFICVLHPQVGKMATEVPGITSRHGCVKRNKKSDIFLGSRESFPRKFSFLEAEKLFLELLLQASSHAFSTTIVSNTLS